jgi:uncharacterized protein (TIGR02145 family)
VAGSKMKLNNTGYSSWDAGSYNNGNSFGFSGLPAGIRFFNGGFINRGNDAYFWETTENDATYAYYRSLNYGYSDLFRYNYSIYKASGFSVRCVRD